MAAVDFQLCAVLRPRCVRLGTAGVFYGERGVCTGDDGRVLEALGDLGLGWRSDRANTVENYWEHALENQVPRSDEQMAAYGRGRSG